MQLCLITTALRPAALLPVAKWWCRALQSPLRPQPHFGPGKETQAGLDSGNCTWFPQLCSSSTEAAAKQAVSLFRKSVHTQLVKNRCCSRRSALMSYVRPFPHAAAPASLPCYDIIAVYHQTGTGAGQVCGREEVDIQRTCWFPRWRPALSATPLSEVCWTSSQSDSQTPSRAVRAPARK